MSMELFSPPPFKVVGDAQETDVATGKTATVLDANGKPSVITGTGSGGGGGSNIRDWSAYDTIFNINPHSRVNNVPANTWNTVINVTGEGVLNWVRFDISGGTGSLKITADGVSFVVGTTSPTYGSPGQELKIDVPFNSSLIVETMATGIANHTCYYSYLLKKTGVTPSSDITLFSQASRLLVSKNNITTTFSDVLNLTGKSGYILRIKYGSYNTSASAKAGATGYITIDGVNHEDGTWNQYTSYGFESNYYGPFRFNSSVDIKVKTVLSSGTAAYCEILYTLDT